jgi:hypothetical protein
MLIGVRKRFVFVANSKAASTAIEAALMDHAEIHRIVGPRRKHVALTEVLDIYGFLFDQPAYAPETFFKFGVLRDPIAWIHSWYRYRKGNATEAPLPAGMDFAAFWARRDWNFRMPDGSKRLQSRFFTGPDGAPIVDYLIPYEALEEHFALICQRLGLAARLGRANVSRIGADAEPALPAALIDELRAFYAEDYALRARMAAVNADGLARLDARRAVG